MQSNRGRQAWVAATRRRRAVRSGGGQPASRRRRRSSRRRRPSWRRWRRTPWWRWPAALRSKREQDHEHDPSSSFVALDLSGGLAAGLLGGAGFDACPAGPCRRRNDAHRRRLGIFVMRRQSSRRSSTTPHRRSRRLRPLLPPTISRPREAARARRRQAQGSGWRDGNLRTDRAKPRPRRSSSPT